MRGRKPVPTEQRIAEGGREVSHRRVPEVVVATGRAIPEELQEPPAWLPKAAKEFWGDAITRLIDVGLIDRVDIPQLEMLAVQYARFRQSARVLAEQGHYVQGSRGQIREHPALKIERDSIVVFSRLAEMFALNPVARTRLGLAELHRKTLEAEMTDALGAPQLSPVDAG